MSRTGCKIPQVEVKSRAELRTWLTAHHEQTHGVWLVTYKKAAGLFYLPYDSIVEEALCFGWIDSLPRELDAMRSMRLISPRKPGSAWSKVNKARTEKLIQQNLMTEAGWAKIREAKADGSWNRLDQVEELEIPPDLAEALAQHPSAAEFFNQFPRSSKRQILEWILQAKRPETRKRRIEETARLAAKNQRALQNRSS